MLNYVEREGAAKDLVSVEIVVERESQKGVMVGKVRGKFRRFGRLGRFGRFGRWGVKLVGWLGSCEWLVANA